MIIIIYYVIVQNFNVISTAMFFINILVYALKSSENIFRYLDFTVRLSNLFDKSCFMCFIG